MFDGTIFAGTHTFTLTVENTPPEVDAGPAATINEGDEFAFAGSFTDLNDDPWTATVDYGDGAGAVGLGLNPDKTFDLSHVYPNNDVFTVTVIVNDGETTDTATVAVTVDNVTPIVDAGADATVDEGTVFSRTGSITDPGSETWTATVDYGDIGGPGPVSLTINPDYSFELSHTYADNNGIFTVTVFVDDGDDTDTDTVFVTVQNVAPVIGFPNGLSVDASGNFTRPGFFSDPGADIWTATVDYGEGAGTGTLNLNGDKTFDLSHTYALDGTYTVSVEVTDDDGDSDTVSFDVFIFFAPPVDPNLNHPPSGDQTTTAGALFFTNNQDIWGAGGAATYNLFTPQAWDVSGGVSLFVTIAGLKAGGGITAGTSGHLELRGEATGLVGTTGVDYNGDVSITFPTPNSFLAGDAVANTSGWILQAAGTSIDAGTTEGNLKVVFDFGISAFIDAEVCLFVGCVTGGTGDVGFDIHLTLFDFSIAGKVTGFVPVQVLVDLFAPFDADFGPISVQPATDSVNTGTGEVTVSGSNIFSTVSVDLDEVASLIPGVPSLGIGFSVLGVTITADLFDITHNLIFSANQTLEFNADVLIKLDFSSPVAGVLGSTESVVGTPGSVTSVTYRAGDNIQIVFPLGRIFPITVTPTAFLANSTLNNLTDIVTESNIKMFALRAEFTVPGFVIIPDIHIHFNDFLLHPECHGAFCVNFHFHDHTHHIEITGISFNGISVVAGPVWESGPQGVITRTDNIANQTFALGGFNQVQLANYLLDPEVPPTADANGAGIGTYTVAEGSVVQVDGSGSFDVDVPAQILTYSWDMDNDGIFETTGSQPNFTLGLDGPKTFPITLKVCDPLNCDTDDAVVAVTNVAPIITVGNFTIDEGESVVVTGTFTDPAAGVPTETFTGTAVWNDNTVTTLTITVGVGAGTFSTTRLFPDDHPDTGTISDDFTVDITITDDDGGTDTKTSTVTVNDVPPTVVTSLSSQNIQYSDEIIPVVITASDVLGDSLVATVTLPDAGTVVGGLELVGANPQFLGAGSWTLQGVADLAPGTYTITVTITDDDTGATSVDITIIVDPEDATVSFGEDNPVAVRVIEDGGDSIPFTLDISYVETSPDTSTGTPEPGDIDQGRVTVTLEPIGPGKKVTGNCSLPVAGEVTCGFTDVPVNAYSVIAKVSRFYIGRGEDVLVVYDPSLGFATGGGKFLWPGTQDRTNFGFNMKYNTNSKVLKPQGSFLMIRHVDDPINPNFRVKSNKMTALAIGEDVTAGFGWASFTGQNTYREPGWLESEGNHRFTVYVEDRGDPGSDQENPDRFWIEVRTADEVVIAILSFPRSDEASTQASGEANAVDLLGGNVQVPHSTTSKPLGDTTGTQSNGGGNKK